MYFDVAGVEVSPWLPPLVGFAISLFTSMGGVSGAFLLLPFQVSVLGFTSPAVSATNQVFNVVATPSGIYRYLREGRMVWPLAWVIVAGTLPGVALGALLRIALLPDARDFKLFVAAVLLYIGLRLGRDILSRGQRPGGPPQTATVVPARIPFRIAYRYGGELFTANRWGVFALALIVGVIGGAYGIGGGAIMAPFLVSLFALPVHTVAGATLLGTLVTSVAGVAFYHLIAPVFPHMAVAPDWGLGLLFGLGGAAGMYSGARLQRYVPARTLKLLLVVCLVGPAAGYVYEFFVGG
ncbi:sulfite exporter TauE/SafE family protein [Thiohalomonas denitrificans]|uniref:sulfite exporter TauE/SafE family protein n=1 Tax=Thiohalomonas denitrificans TaxID=415747 RepID=UPI0026EF6B47|nr:sulfite exporter TauE/SafE family protein [Thiohalomonas denitrificans]